MAQPTTIHFIRHGEVHNPQQILYGRLPNFRLSDNGRQQAASAAHAMSNRSLAAFYASPQPRAQETASIIVQHHAHLSVITEPRVDEIHSPYEGTPLNNLEAMGWDLYTGIDAAYEQPVDVLKRTQDFVGHVLQTYAGQEVATVTHGDVIAFMIMYAHNDLAQAGKKFSFAKYGLPEVYPATASISSFTYSTNAQDERPQLTYQRPY